MGHIGYRSIIGEISMNPYISGQNLAKFGGGGGGRRKFIDLRKQYWRREKMFLPKLVLDIRFRC